jgi:hypothetical protein
MITHKEKIVLQQRKFMFQFKLKWEFNEEYYDEWNDISFKCDSDWYDLENGIENKQILEKYIKTKYEYSLTFRYLNYYRHIIFGPLLAYVGPITIRKTNLDTTTQSYSINSNLMM